MKRILYIVGARPQFIKLAALWPVRSPSFQHLVVHTGQHYDEALSARFFQEFELPEPDVNLQVGSGKHGTQTGLMLQRLEPLLEDLKPDLLVLFGDTNSTLAGALVAAKLSLPIAHVEAGLRSFTPMPEEINRVLTDRLSTLLFAPSEQSRTWLAEEGIRQGVHVVGDVMLDLALRFTRDRTNQSSQPQESQPFILLTLHRAENTDHQERLKVILETLVERSEKILFPVHPRTRQALERFGLTELLTSTCIEALEPLSYREMLDLLSRCRIFVTDSGGAQKEAFFLGRPCLTLRHTTEWTETVELGFNRLVDADPDLIRKGLEGFEVPDVPPEVYGDGKAAEKITKLVERFLQE